MMLLTIGMYFSTIALVDTSHVDLTATTYMYIHWMVIN